MNPLNVAPTICPQCSHRFPPGAPEPARCPDCGRESSGHGESKEPKKPIADELLFRSEQRAYWTICFWVLVLVGPLYPVALIYFHWDLRSSLPASLLPYAGFSANPIVLPCVCAAGAGFCLANLWFPRQRFRDILAYSFLIALVLMAVYGGLFLAASIVQAIIAHRNR
jgi:hypothetical protein